MMVRPLLLCLTACAFWSASPASAQVSELASKIQPGANVVVAMDLDALQKTPMADTEGWTKKLESAYVDRSIFLPPEASLAVIGGLILPERNFEHAWEMAVMNLKAPVAPSSLARAEGGYVDTVAGMDIVWSPSDAYLVPFAERTLGVVYPASRQAVARWIESASERRQPALSPYLSSAISKVGPTTQYVLALDLEAAASPQRVRERIESMPPPPGAKLTVDDVVKLASSLRGLTFEISVTDRAQARGRIDFAAPISLSAAEAKQLVLTALQMQGVALDDLAKHTFQVEQSAITVEGMISPEGLRRLFSVLEIPTTKFSELSEQTAGSAADEPSSQADMAKNSQTYFKSVVSLLDDLRGDRDKQDTRGGYDAVWMERYAQKIDRLPILNVDPDLLEWGSNTSETLRMMASTRRNAGLATGSQQSALRTSSYSNNYYSGTFNTPRSAAVGNQLDRAQIQRQNQNQATSRRVEGYQLIDNSTSDIRRTMTERYGVEF